MQITNKLINVPKKFILASAIAGAGIAGGVAIHQNQQKNTDEAKIEQMCEDLKIPNSDSYGRAMVRKAYLKANYKFFTDTEYKQMQSNFDAMIKENRKNAPKESKLVDDLINTVKNRDSFSEAAYNGYKDMAE